MILHGNLASEGAVAKISGKEGLKFHRPGRAYLIPRKAALEKILDGSDCERRRGGDSLRRTARRLRDARDAVPDFSHHGQRIGQGCGAHHRRTVLRRQPRLSWWAISRRKLTWAERWRSAGKNGDSITIDAEKRQINLDIPGRRIEEAQAGVEKMPRPATPAACWRKYAAHVTSASLGAVTDMDLEL